MSATKSTGVVSSTEENKIRESPVPQSRTDLRIKLEITDTNQNVFNKCVTIFIK